MVLGHYSPDCSHLELITVIIYMLLLLTQFSAIIFWKPILMLVLTSSACYVAAIS